METRRPRSKRQLYLGILCVSLAFIAAILRSGFPSATPPIGNAPELLNITVEQSFEILGEPTTRIEFYPDEDFHSERAALIDRLEKSGAPVPDVFVELAWLDETQVVTLRFAADTDDQGTVSISGPSIDANRSPRLPAE